MSTDNHEPPPPPVPKSLGGKLWTGVRVFFARLRFIMLMVIVGVIAGNWDTILNHYDRWTRPAAASEEVAGQHVEYYCPMHPKVIREEPGKCPICGMPLSKRAKSAGPASMPAGVLAQVQLTPQKMELGRIETSPIEYRLLGREVRTVGEVGYDETERSFIAARTKGRLDKLLVNYTGQRVEKGQRLAEIYSPDLLVAQEELLVADRGLRSVADPNSPVATGPRALLEAARKKLALWGVTEEQMADVLRRGTPFDHLDILSPRTGIVTEKKVLEGQYVMEGQDLYTVADLGSVWMQMQIFESDLPGVREGLYVAVTTRAHGAEIFPGTIQFISYTVDERTRTASARVAIKNPEYKLKPGMYAEATLHLPFREPVEMSPPAQGATTTVPATGTAPATAPARAPDTRGLVKAYLAASIAYAADKIDANAVEALAHEAGALAGQGPDFAGLSAAAKALPGKTLADQREQFKAVTEAMKKALRLAPPEGIPLYIAYCPMAKADWLTDSNAILNPYKGSEMLTCGSITGPLEVEAAPASMPATRPQFEYYCEMHPQIVRDAPGNCPICGMNLTKRVKPAPGAAPAGLPTSDGGRYQYGYYCPIIPDRLFEKPEECPIDKFPFRYVKAERTVAVPESAVIDTGLRQVVYRETSAGSFDMVEVKLGPREGEFYPVLSGLAVGDRVATRGAFAVDAENRLNPAAAAQYFGASGGPKAGAAPAGGGHQH